MSEKQEQKVQDMLEIVVALPPNFDSIQVALPHANHTHTYCYGDKIYNPSGAKLPIDVQYHEYIHSQQQEAMGVEAWWSKYLLDTDFRLEQEIEAYGEQYAFAKKSLEDTDNDIRWRAVFRGEKAQHLGGGVNNILKQILFSMAKALSGEAYGSLLSFGAAERAIKKYGKEK